MSKVVSKHIRLNEEVLKLLEQEAKSYGFGINEWLRITLESNAVKYSKRKESTREVVFQILARYKLTPKSYRDYKSDKEVQKVIDSLKDL